MVERLDEEHTTKSGIVVHTYDDKKAYHGLIGRVIALDPSKEHTDGIEVGDEVLYNRFDALPFLHNTTAYDALSYSQLYAKIVKDVVA